jgi:uncharacterized membrane protein YbhN (UPF0104 family)
MLKWLKYIIGVIIIFFLMRYLAQHWQEVKALLKLDVFELAVIYFVSFVGSLNSAMMARIILKPMGVIALFWDMVMLQNACLLLNYVPMKFGTFFMANYLKKHYSLKYSHFGTFSVYLTLLMCAVAALIGMFGLISVYGLADVQKQILAGVFLVCFIVSVFFMFVPLPVTTGTSRLAIILRDFLDSRRVVTQDKKALFMAVFSLLFSFVVTSVRLAVIYHSIGRDIHPVGYFVLGALGYMMMFVNLTPGALGIREAALSAGAVVLGVPPEVGVTAAIIDRAVILSWAFVVGGICAGWLWHKSPADFRKDNNNQTANGG